MTGQQGIRKTSELQHQTFYLVCVQLGMVKTYTQVLFLTLLVLRICCGFKFYFIEKKCKKPKWLSGEALQIAVKRREVKSKGERNDINI